MRLEWSFNRVLPAWYLETDAWYLGTEQGVYWIFREDGKWLLSLRFESEPHKYLGYFDTADQAKLKAEELILDNKP